MKRINWSNVKTIIRGWRTGDYLRQFSIVTAGIIVTFVGSDLITDHARQREVQATMHLVAEELKQNRENLQVIIEKTNVDRHIARIVLANDFIKDSIPEDTLIRYQSFFGNLTSYSYTTDALEVLKGSSLMQYVTDKKLLQDITNTYYQLNNAKEDVSSYYKMKADIINGVIQGLSKQQLMGFMKGNVQLVDVFFAQAQWCTFCYLVPDFLDWDNFAKLDSTLNRQIQTLEIKYK